jgi:hypothetical protein
LTFPGNLVIKYFSERINFDVGETAAKTEAFDIWKEAFLHERHVQQAEELKLREERRQEEETRTRKEREIHMKTRGDMLVK